MLYLSNYTWKQIPLKIKLPALFKPASGIYSPFSLLELTTSTCVHTSVDHVQAGDVMHSGLSLNFVPNVGVNTWYQKSECRMDLASSVVKNVAVLRRMLFPFT